MSILTTVGNFFGIGESKEFDTLLEHGKDYEFMFEVKGEITPENYIAVRKTIMEKIPDVVFKSIDFIPEARMLSVKIHYTSPAIPLVAWGLATLIISAISFIGLRLVLKDVKEVTPTVVEGFSISIGMIIALLIVLIIGYKSVFAHKIGG